MVRVVYCTARVVYCMVRVVYCTSRVLYESCIALYESCIVRVVYCIVRVVYCTSRVLYESCTVLSEPTVLPTRLGVRSARSGARNVTIYLPSYVFHGVLHIEKLSGDVLLGTLMQGHLHLRKKQLVQNLYRMSCPNTGKPRMFLPATACPGDAIL